MRLHRLDLNLLIALDALLSLKNVTAAALRLHVTQPTMSAALARLREHFEDALLRQVGRGFELTELGRQLQLPVREALDRAEVAVDMRAHFDPATARRRFALGASDSTILRLLCDVIARVELLAPGVTFELIPAEPSRSAGALERGELDFLFSGPTLNFPGHPHVRVIADRYQCIAWRHNPLVGRTLTAEVFRQCGHVVTMHGIDRWQSFEELQFERLGVERRIEVVCPTPALLGALVVGTRRLATLPARLAATQAKTLPLRVFPPPVTLEEQTIDMYWHRRRDSDPGTRWFRDVVREASVELGLLPSEAAVPQPVDP